MWGQPPSAVRQAQPGHFLTRLSRQGCEPPPLAQARLKYCTALSCFFAAAREENVPKFFRFPVFASFLREYKRYSPDCSLRIMNKRCRGPA